MIKSIEHEGVNIAYGDVGAGDTTLLFVHGAFIDMSYWSAQVEHFRHRYRVITIDLPGHGKSGKNHTKWTIQRYGVYIRALIEEFRLSRVVLIGHSMGGDVILEVATQCPETVIGFIGIDNFKNAGTAMPQEIQDQFGYFLQMLDSDFANTSEGYARQVLLTSATDTSIAGRVLADFRNTDKQMGIGLIANCFNYFDRERELMNLLKLKMYLVNVDYYPTNEHLLEKYAASGYGIITINGTCHYPMIENPMELNRALESVLEHLN
jgi:pimeloyl-ACP methyl ester carboxylesterase